jgi:predicted Fe-Mo cluster-binding NifX family protein
VRLVAVPCEAGEDLDTERSAHFGRAPAFGLVRLERDSMVGWWIASNPAAGHSGHGAVAAMLLEEGVTDIVTAGIGAGMYRRLAEAGVRLWREQDAATVRSAIEALVEGRAVPIAEGDLHEGHGA